MTTPKPSLLRVRHEGEETRVGFVELFFDLVFVFAITQLSHFLLEHFTPLGGLLTTLLLMAVWWVWIYTGWVTNWLDPDKIQVRLMLFVLMLAGLVLSTSIPEAFGARGLSFALAFVLMQVGRSLFMLWAVHGVDHGNYRNFQRITTWLAVSGMFWLAGGVAEGGARLGLWAVAIAIEYVSPAVGFFVPGLGRSETTDWDVEGGHLAERCGLFIIIALGESILVTGATFARLDWTPRAATAFVLAFAGSIAMWWIYFNVGAERGSRHIARSSDPGRVARFAYTYIHLLLVGGIILAAVGDELVLAHPLGYPDLKTAIAVVGGAALYVAGNLLFKNAITGVWALSHLIGLGLLALCAVLTPFVPPLLQSAVTVAALIAVAMLEMRFTRLRTSER
jgi:low temperature requirement protein LtrA